MTTTNHTEPISPDAAIVRAAALLAAVARDSEQAVDFEVPLRCGQAANRLHAVLGSTPAQVPSVRDDASDIGAAIAEAVGLLSALAREDLTDPILDALRDARAAAMVAGEAGR